MALDSQTLEDNAAPAPAREDTTDNNIPQITSDDEAPLPVLPQSAKRKYSFKAEDS